MSKKVDILYKNFQEHSGEILKDNQEYQEAQKECLEAMYDLRNGLAKEKTKQVNNYDDKSIKAQGVLLETYYKQGYKDGSK